MTKKLHLDLAGLRVESFAANVDTSSRGTVAGNETNIIINTCFGTCDVNVGTCNHAGTCCDTVCTSKPEC